MSGRTRRRIIVAMRVAAIVTAALATAGVALVGWEVWDPSTWVKVLLLGAIAGVAIGEQIRAIVVQARGPAISEFRSAVNSVLVAALLDVSDESGYDKRCVGVTAWRIRVSWLWSRRQPWFKRETHLVRTGHQRFADLPQPSSVVWTKGKGVLGTAWEREVPVHKDLRQAGRKYGDGKLTEERFQRIDKNLRLNMSFDDFRTMIGKYGEVLAVPVKNRHGHVLGCVTVDVPLERCDEEGTGRLDHEDVKQVMGTAAKVVGLLYRPE